MKMLIKSFLLAGSVTITSAYSMSTNANALKEKAVGILEQSLLIRIENSKIVEHWDVIQAVPSEMAHKNGMF